ncbi:large proline-rich protein BAG6 isoform X2 [Athalia rosae]|uniref:large proline-rich protein BAG6 isoform X2 n=1 Tax=Athalia rosae TaxID=37344 RepID=UPI002033BC36|nr:large proline-rich protein BAG6 isoform X2 [Athalia rosae]
MIDLTVKTLDSRNHSFSLEDDITVQEFKEQIAESVAVPADSQRLIYCGRVLQNEKKLIDYDVNGKVIHLVQRAPPQSGQRGNSSGQGQSQDQGQSQGQSTNSHRPHFRHARAQVRLPRINGNAMYLGAMSFPADAEGPGIPRPQIYNRQPQTLLELVDDMLLKANRSLHLLENPSSAPAQDQQPSEQQQEPEQEQDQEQDQEQEQDDGSFEIGGGATGGGFAQAASAAINAALSAAGFNHAALSTAALSSMTFLGPQSDGANPAIIHIQRNTDDADSGMAVHLNSILQSSLAQQQPQEQQQSPSVPLPQQQQEQPQPQQSPQSQQPAQPQQQPQQQTAANGQFNAAPQRPVLPAPGPHQLRPRISHLCQTHDRLRPYLERYRDLMEADPPVAEGVTEGPDSVAERQRLVNRVSESLHHLAHASHALSDIIVDMNEPPPRTLRCRPFVSPESALLQAGMPIQVEAHISLHGRNQNVNNNNEGAHSTAPVPGTTPAAASSAENSEPATESNDTTNTNQQSEPASNQQQQTFGTVFNVPHNVEVLMEMGPDITVTGQNQANANRNNNNNRNPGGFPWGASPPPELLRRMIMQLIAGRMGPGVTTVTAPIPTTSAAPATGEQQSTNSDGAPIVTTVTMEGSDSNPGQSTQARGNSGTHPTTSTQTRSTPRPHVFHSNTIHLRMFDPFLRCNSHHIRHSNTAPILPSNTSSTFNIVSGQQQQTNSNSAANDQTQTATSSSNLGANPPTSETNSSTGNAPSATPQQAANPLVNLLTQILGGIGAQPGQMQTTSGGWMPLFTGRIPVLQNLLGNGSNQAGGGMTLIDLLQNTPGLGVSANIGMINPLRMGQNIQGEDLLLDLVFTVAQSITLEGWESHQMGHWEPLAGIRRPIREFFQNFFGSTSLSGSEDRVVDRLISELQPTLNQLLVEDTNTRNGTERGVDIPATIERLLRRHFLNILRLLFDNDVDDTRFAQGLLASIKTLQTEACSVLQYCFRGRQLRIETVAQRIITRVTEGVEPGVRQWIINSCVSLVCSYLAHMIQLPDDEVVPLLVLRTVSRSPPATPLVQQYVTQQTQSEPEPMETDAVEERVDAGIVDAEEGATFPGHDALPSDWVPIIARDGVRQRHQLQVQMHSQGMGESGVGGFSDAYLGGMPSKRRKLIEQQKPRILLSPTPNHSAVSISVERLTRESIGRAGVEEVEGVGATVAADVGVRRAFGQAIRGCLHQHPQRQTAPDFPDPLRFPNATKYFAKKDETSKK